MECDQLYCEECITNWIKKNKACPHCRKDFEKAKLNRYVKNMIYDLTLNCPEVICGKSLKYKELMTHLKDDCQYITFSCSYDCGTKGRRD